MRSNNGAPEENCYPREKPVAEENPTPESEIEETEAPEVEAHSVVPPSIGESAISCAVH